MSLETILLKEFICYKKEEIQKQAGSSTVYQEKKDTRLGVLVNSCIRELYIIWVRKKEKKILCSLAVGGVELCG